MPTASLFPVYRLPISLVLGIMASFIAGKKRDYRKDAARACKGITPPPVVCGAENIPFKGPLLVTLNHYSRSGFFIIWASFAIAASLPVNSIWMMTRAWTDRGTGWDRLRTGLTTLVFKRLADIYGFITIPAMPPDPDEIIDRAVSIRKLMNSLQSQPQAMLCLAPEGMDFSGGVLGSPFPGSGKLIFQISKILKNIQPVGVYEEKGKLIIKFGKIYPLEVCNDSESVDEFVIHSVMEKIAELLPERMRGGYA